MKTKIAFLVIALFSTGILLAQSASDPKHKVVIQFNDADSVSHTRVLMQVENVRKVWATAEIEVVCLSGGLDLLTKKGSKMSQQIAEWKQKGVDFLACNNTMMLRKIAKEDLIAPALVIPSAVIELALKQEAGWSYFRGGK
jgi:intracellular sulfur oxidation DsrE/DsrF family protein